MSQNDHKKIRLLAIFLVCLASSAVASEARRIYFSAAFLSNLPDVNSPCWVGVQNGLSCDLETWPYWGRQGVYQAKLKKIVSTNNVLPLIGNLFFKPYSFYASSDKPAIYLFSGHPDPYEWLNRPYAVRSAIQGWVNFAPSESKPILRFFLQAGGISYFNSSSFSFKITRADGSVYNHIVKVDGKEASVDISSVLQPGDTVEPDLKDEDGWPHDLFLLSSYIETNAADKIASLPGFSPSQLLTAGGIPLPLKKKDCPIKTSFNGSNDQYLMGCNASATNIGETSSVADLPVKTIIEPYFSESCKNYKSFVRVVRKSDQQTFKVPIDAGAVGVINDNGQPMGQFSASVENIGLQPDSCFFQINVQNDIPDTTQFLKDHPESEINQTIENMLLFKANALASLDSQGDLACFIQNLQDDVFFSSDYLAGLEDLFYHQFAKPYDAALCSSAGSNFALLDQADCSRSSDLFCQNVNAYRKYRHDLNDFLYKIKIALIKLEYVPASDRQTLLSFQEKITSRASVVSSLESHFNQLLDYRIASYIFQKVFYSSPSPEIQQTLYNQLRESSALDLWENLKAGKPQYSYAGNQVNLNNSCDFFSASDIGYLNFGVFQGTNHGCDAGILIPSVLSENGSFHAEVKSKVVGGAQYLIDNWNTHVSLPGYITQSRVVDGWKVDTVVFPQTFDPTFESHFVIRANLNSNILIDSIKIARN